MSAIPVEEMTVDRKARMRLPLEDLRARPAEERRSNFEPTYYPLTEAEAKRAAERCIH